MQPGSMTRLARIFRRKFAGQTPLAGDFKKVVAGRKLWNFDKREWKLWQEAL